MDERAPLSTGPARADLADLFQLLRAGLRPAYPALAAGPCLATPRSPMWQRSSDARLRPDASVPAERGEAIESRETDETDETDGTDGAGDSGGPADPDDPSHREVWELVNAAQGGDAEAFGQLYDRYVDTVYKFIFYRVNDRALAEDFTSETFLRALRRIKTISYQGRDIGAWFVTIARNIVFDHTKSARHRRETSTGETLEGDQSTPGPETAVVDADTTAHLMAAVRQLNDEQRECITLRFIRGLSVSETAAAMGKNDGSIKALQHRAVKKLAAIVGDTLL